MRQLLFPCLAAMILGLCGCGSSKERQMQTQIQAMNDLAEAIETKQPEEKIKAAEKRLGEIQVQMLQVALNEGGSKAEEDDRLAKKYDAELNKATSRLAKAQSERMSVEMKKQWDKAVKDAKK